MLRTTRRVAFTLTAALSIVVLGAAAALADAGDNLSPANTSFTVANSGNVTIKGSIDGLPATVTCTSVTLSAKTPASGLTASVTSSPPATFSGCTDSLGGRDTVTTSGTWSLTEADNAGEGGTEPNSGDQLTINIPAGGAKFSSTFLPSCTITVGASTPTGSYDDSVTSVFASANLNVSGSGCAAGTPSKFSGTFKNSISIHDTN